MIFISIGSFNYLILYLPRSKILSKIFTGFVSRLGVSIISTVVFPGFSSMARRIPKLALNRDVMAKYINVRVVILLLNELFTDDVPTIKLEIINGRMSSFSSRIKSSPGNDRIRSRSGGIFIGRIRIPNKE